MPPTRRRRRPCWAAATRWPGRLTTRTGRNGHWTVRSATSSAHSPRSRPECCPAGPGRCSRSAPPWEGWSARSKRNTAPRSEEHTSELQSHVNLVCRLLLEKKKKKQQNQKTKKTNKNNKN